LVRSPRSFRRARIAFDVRITIPQWLWPEELGEPSSVFDFLVHVEDRRFEAFGQGRPNPAGPLHEIDLQGARVVAEATGLTGITHFEEPFRAAAGPVRLRGLASSVKRSPRSPPCSCAAREEVRADGISKRTSLT
jgi:hypothetical protein